MNEVQCQMGAMRDPAKMQVSKVGGAANPFVVSPVGQDPSMHLDYLVLYVRDPETSAKWYTDALALRFTMERHGANGPIHYSTQLDGTVLELYPAGDRPITRARIGLVVRDPFGVGPEPTTVTDPDGNTIAIEVRAASA